MRHYCALFQICGSQSQYHYRDSHIRVDRYIRDAFQDLHLLPRRVSVCAVRDQKCSRGHWPGDGKKKKKIRRKMEDGEGTAHPSDPSIQ
jgi:hypothetical protein